jgi:uncharacterized protein with GYD domain
LRYPKSQGWIAKYCGPPFSCGTPTSEAKTIGTPSGANFKISPQAEGGFSAAKSLPASNKDIDGKLRSRFDRPHENKHDWLDFGALLFGAALCFADDPQMDTSKLNEPKSKLTPGTEKIKPTYISLVQFTDKGIQGAKQTTQRVAAWAAKVQSMGVTIKQMYWTLGQYDQVCIFEAPDDETAASVLLAADMLGNIRTQTMRAFTASEMEKILAKVP